MKSIYLNGRDEEIADSKSIGPDNALKSFKENFKIRY